MRGPKPSYPITLTEAEVKRLHDLVRAHKTGQSLAVCARIVLSANMHPEWNNQQIAQEIGTTEEQSELAGLFAGNPTRRTSQPTTECLLEAFSNVTLTIVRAPGFAQRHVTPLSSLQLQILTLLGFSPRVYLQLQDDS